MNSNERFKKTTEILNKFQNIGLYQNSAMFHNIVQQLVENDNPYLIIEMLIENIEIQNNAFQQYIQRDTRPQIMPDGELYKVNYDSDVLNYLMGKKQ